MKKLIFFNQSNQIRIFIVQKSHLPNFLHDWWVGYPPSIFILSCHYWTLLCTAKLSWESKNTDRQMILQENGQLVFYVCFQIYPQLCVKRLCNFMRVFTYVSSNRLPEKKHSHIGCICLTFLQCVFSYDSSNHLPGQMQSHIGCICLAFLHCAFSSVS